MSSFKKANDAVLDAIGISMHHDAITGTEKQFVADDYAYRMSRAAAIADRVTSHALRVLIGEPGDVSLVRCPDMNASSCHLSSQSGLERFTVVVYNPMGRLRAIPVRLPIADADTASTISVTSSGTEVRSAVLPSPPVTRLQRPGLPPDTAKQLLVYEYLLGCERCGAAIDCLLAHWTDNNPVSPSVLRKFFITTAVRLRAETSGGCSVRATTVWRHPVAHWTSRYNFYVHNGWMHRRKGEPLPPLLEWVRENPNDQTHDLLRGALRNFNHRIRNNDTLLHWQAMRTLRHFDLLFPIERLAQLARPARVS